MADIKVSDMTVATTPFSGTEEIYVVQSGSKKITVDALDDHLSQTQKTLTNKTLGTATAVGIGSDAGGDTWYRDGLTGELVRVPIGTEGQVYTVDGAGAPVWADPTGGGGLIYFVESESTTAPNDVSTVSALTVVSAQADADAIFVAKGTGATLAQIPDNTAAGGYKRGTFATDWQKARNDATQTASGYYSTISGGANNTASGGISTVSGGRNNTASSYDSTVSGGYNNTASSYNSTVSGGRNNTASGKSSWIPGGYNANTRGITGSYAYSNSGDSQIIGLPLVLDTINDTPTSMSSEYSVLDATTTMIVPASSSMLVTAMVLARSDAGDNAAWIAQALFSSDAFGTLTKHGSATVTPVGTPSASLSTATIDLIVNGTTGSADVEVTGVTATNIRWGGELKCVQIVKDIIDGV